MAAFAVFRKDRPCELLAQCGGGEIFDAVAFRIVAGDLGGAEQHVPEEQQVPEIALIVGDAVADSGRLGGHLPASGNQRITPP